LQKWPITKAISFDIMHVIKRLMVNYNTPRQYQYLNFNWIDFYPRDAMLARVIVIATCLSVRLSVHLSVRPSRVGIVSKQRKLAA